MTQWLVRAVLTAGLLAAAAPVSAVPIPVERKEGTIADPSGFIPYRKHVPIPGKIVAVLITDAEPMLKMEGRFGPADQLCLGWNGGSYRWVYVPCDDKPHITNLALALPGGKSKVYPKLNMANPKSLKPWGIDSLYTLVEVEVNDGAGSPAEDAFVATKMKKLDGSKEYPIQTEAVIADLQKQYAAHLSERQKDLDAAMDAAAKKAVKDRQPTGPREKYTLMFITWLPETEQLQVRFLTKITDGAYEYGNGIKIELPPAPLPPAPPQGGIAPPPILPHGLRHGTQFGIEFGGQFTVSKDGKIDRMKTLEPRAFQTELPKPPLFKKKQPLALPMPPIAPTKQ